MHDESDPVRQDQLRRAVELVGANRMRNGLIDLALLQIPLAGAVVQPDPESAARSAVPPAGAVAGEPMEPEPLAWVSSPTRKRLPVACRAGVEAESVRSVIASLNGAANSSNDGDGLQKLAIGGAQSIEELGAQVVIDLGDVAVVQSRAPGCQELE